MSSPAERYAAAKANARYPLLRSFTASVPFDLDDFQIEACRSLEEGHGVLVAAPTGSGKTIVGEFAVHLALAAGSKCFYTTPIKALSNQKFNDLVELHGADNVGLLTGDHSVNGEAPIVVMTTEVLRNMIYAGSSTLRGLSHVVMDEVHYLADRFRGAVWEEIIIGLPESVSIIALSATVSNVEEFGDWLTAVRGDTRTVLSEHRPVPLSQHVMVGRRLIPLFEPGSTKVNHTLENMARSDAQWTRAFDKNRSAKRGTGGRRPRSRHRTPDRVDVVMGLASAELLPAICFIFSRAGCDDAVRHCLQSQIVLTDQDEADEILDHVEKACAHLTRQDLEVLRFEEFKMAISRGIASHHAGMLPTFKECVEDLFSRGLVKMVFATETLALGINMPARSVAIERLTKWNGDTHVEVTPGEYTQLTGRAGRRGIDTEGHGVVLWQPGFDARHVANLASTRTYPLRSSFRPSYNMAVNMVNQVGRDRARDLLEQSFAQFQADRAVVGPARQLHKTTEALDGYRDAAACDMGDFFDYMSLRHQISTIERSGNKARRAARRDKTAASILALRPGDIIEVPSGKWAGPAVVIEPGRADDHDGPRPFVVTLSRHARRLSIHDFPFPVEPITRMKLPKQFKPRSAEDRRRLAGTLQARLGQANYRRAPKRRRDDGNDPDPRLDALRQQLRDHPCHDCPERDAHARWAQRYFTLQREASQLEQKVKEQTHSVSRQFDRVCEVLTELGYIEGDDITDAGRTLQRIYSEKDLVVSEGLRRGLWDGLTPAEFAAVTSGLTYEPRARDEAAAPSMPTAAINSAASALMVLSNELQALERNHRVAFLRPPEFGFAHAVWFWCEGGSLDDVLPYAQMAAGDFVRAMKMLIDATGQIAHAATEPQVRRTALAAMDLLRTGIVAYSALEDA